MDQQAFRDLISTSSSSAGTPSSSSKPRVFGAPQKRSAGPSSSSSASNDLFAPRKKTTKEQNKSGPRPPPKNSATGETYVDRAKARRFGQEDKDYAEVNRLAEEWRTKWSNAKDEEERREIEEQMAFLGGDARHSILVKGLDYSLLAQQKAKEAGAEADVDEHLERTYDSVAAKVASPDPSRHEEGTPVKGHAGEKRSRESVIDALKRRKLASVGSMVKQNTATSVSKKGICHEEVRDAKLERAKRLGKFKPITATSGGFKAVDADKGEVIVTKDGKRLRKKKKKSNEGKDEQIDSYNGTSATLKQTGETRKSSSTESDVKRHTEPAEAASAYASGPSQLIRQATRSPSRVSLSPPALQKVSEFSGPARAAPSPSAPPPSAATEDLPLKPVAIGAAGEEEEEEEDGDDDIFADAGRWVGLPDDDDDDSEDEEEGAGAGVAREKEGTSNTPSTSLATPTTSLASDPVPHQRKNWFTEDDGDTSIQVGTAPLPAQLHRLLSSVDTTSKSHSNGIRAGQQTEEDEDEDEESQRGHSREVGAEVAGRLQGLSTSSLPSNVSRLLLQAENEEARRLEEKEKGWWKKKKERKRKKGEGEGEVEGKPNDGHGDGA